MRLPKNSLLLLLAAAAGLSGRPGVASGQSVWSPGDTATYSDSTTAATVILSRARHYHRDSIIRNYSSIAVTRIDAGFGRRRFGIIPPILANETMSRVSWQYPDDLRIELLGQRDTSALAGVEEMAVNFDRPWLVPRSVGDSISLLEGDFPENSALHPLAEGAERFYRYEIVDSVRISIPTRTVRAIDLRAVPKENGPALVAGDIWIDADTYEVVRLVVLFTGYALWEKPDGDTPEDSAQAREDNEFANRVLSARADIEYALYETRYWLPVRQTVTLDVELPWVLNIKIPVRFITEFSDYEINTLPPIAFAVPQEELLVPDRKDSTRLVWRDKVVCERCDHSTRTQARRNELGYIRAGSDGHKRWEIVTPPRDSLRAMEWDEPIQLALSDAERDRMRETVSDLARLAESLPADMVGRTESSIAWEELADVVRFNRVQGWSFGLGYQFRPGPDFTTVFAEARFGLGDLRPSAEVAWRREAPEGTFTAGAFLRVAEPDPWARGQSLGNSMNAVFASHDDSDYYRTYGGALSYDFFSNSLQDLRVEAGFERHRSMRTRSGGAFAGLRANPTVLERDFARAVLTNRWESPLALVESGIDGLAGDNLVAGRVWTTIRLKLEALGGVVARGRIGGGAGDSVAQLYYRVGGLQTVRGHAYGERVGESMWSVQLDLPIRRQRALSPVIFFDLGDVFGSSDPLVGFGIGWSLFNGWFRPNLSYGLNPDVGLRFDLVFGAPR